MARRRKRTLAGLPAQVIEKKQALVKEFTAQAAPADRLSALESALANICALFDKAFVGHPVIVNVSLTDRFSALCTPQDEIFIEIPKSWDAFAMVKGLNIHELCHLLYTTFISSFEGIVLGMLPHETVLTMHVQAEPLIRNVANLLEDQRIEFIFSYKYPAARRYFSAVAQQVFNLDPNSRIANVDNMTLLALWGRRFILPVLLPDPRARGVKELTDIIDSYLVSQSDDERFALVVNFIVELVRRDWDSEFKQRTDQSVPDDTVNLPIRITPFPEKISSIEKKSRDAQQLKEEAILNEELSAVLDKLSSKDTEELAKQISEGLSEQDIADQLEKTLAEQGVNVKDYPQIQKEIEDFKNRVTDAWSRAKDDKDKAESVKELAEKVAEQLGNQAHRNLECLKRLSSTNPSAQMAANAIASTLREDVNGVRREITQRVQEILFDDKPTESTRSTEDDINIVIQRGAKFTIYHPPIPAGIIDNVASAIMLARVELGGTYIAEQVAGRLNVESLMRPYLRTPKIFEKYLVGSEEEAMFALGLLVDHSSSMSANDWRRLAVSVAYAIGEAAKLCQCEVYTVSFASKDEAALLSTPWSTGICRQSYTGGTVIAKALDTVMQLLAKSELKNHLYIVITDGYISDMEYLVSKLKAKHCYFVYIGNVGEYLEYLESAAATPSGLISYRLEQNAARMALDFIRGRLYPCKGITELPSIMVKIIEHWLEHKREEVMV